MNVCKNCKYYQERPSNNHSWNYKMCMHPDSIDVVSGEQLECSDARYENKFIPVCGPMGNWFEQKVENATIQNIYTSGIAEG